MKRNVTAPENEPEESNFQLPSEKEHLLQVVDVWPDDKNSDVVIAKIEVVDGDENGRSLLHRVNMNDQDKGFYYTRLFLKAIAEKYKGAFEINDENFIGKQFYATVVHNGKYANIKEYNFDKMVEQVANDTDRTKPVDEEISWDEGVK